VEEDKGGEKIMTNVIRLQPLSKDFLELLYNAYREFKWKDSDNIDTEGIYKFRPLTEFKDIKSEGSTLELLRSPLMARLIMQSFHRSKLPDELNNDEAMRLYLDNIIIEKSDEHQGFPERKKLLNLFVIELDRNNTQRLDRDYLMNIPSIRSYLINNQKDSPYIQLLDLGALMEEWEGDTCFVRFSFDKFFEFLLAELHWPKIHDVAGLFELCRRASNYKILQGAIEIIMIRFCQNEQYNFLVDIIDMAENSNDEVKRVIKEICPDILYELATQQFDLFKKTIDLIPLKPSRFDLEILNQLINKLYLRGHLKEFEFALDTAITEANLLKDKKSLSSLLLKKAKYENLQGRTDEFNTIIESALTLSKDSGNDKIYSHCIIAKATFQRERGFLDESEKLFLEALKINQSLEDQKGISASFSELGTLYLKQSKIQESENLFLQSLQIRRSLGDKLGISSSLSNLGNIYKDKGYIEKSKELHLEALEIRRTLGDIKGIARTLNSLGIIFYSEGKFSEAKSYFLETLDIDKKLSNKRGMCARMANLGVIYYENGEDSLAKEYLLKSVNLESELNISKIASIHRVYHLLDSTERQVFKDVIDKKNENNITKKDRCWIASIELMDMCLDDKNVSATEIISKIDEVSKIKVESKIFDIDDLPIESFYIAAKKLQQFNEPLKAISTAKKTLTWIGERKTRQKYELEKLSTSTAYNSV
jgi:tetratricopeptide (TPR) repeat protein